MPLLVWKTSSSAVIAFSRNLKRTGLRASGRGTERLLHLVLGLPTHLLDQSAGVHQRQILIHLPELTWLRCALAFQQQKSGKGVEIPCVVRKSPIVLTVLPQGSSICSATLPPICLSTLVRTESFGNPAKLSKLRTSQPDSNRLVNR